MVKERVLLIGCQEIAQIRECDLHPSAYGGAKKTHIVHFIKGWAFTDYSMPRL
jgi:hypothetical protein